MGGESRSRVVTSYPQLSKGPVGQQIEGIYTDRLRQFTDGGEPANHWQFMQDG
jgi:alpha-mannosidase